MISRVLISTRTPAFPFSIDHSSISLFCTFGPKGQFPSIRKSLTAPKRGTDEEITGLLLHAGMQRQCTQ
ncbi:uncharacterized protein Bfra_009754 [Botrytis fragariae]|uniref:Uncharacterized protein n=1 Tax=Botrytis fragariae TaxID=1964551 RepID=A0A8H6AN96_9HELO|nr:uncharacterized protein Bfra_009754 [Botrytis fragariae]KAF5870370.1 hypothetical protein Bfra_009754 [Botrytis fragariae]